MNPRALSIITSVALTVLVLQANVLAQEETRDAVSTADPAQEGFSAQRLGEMEKAIQNGDFKQITSVLIARHGRVIYDHYFDKDGVDGLRNTRSAVKTLTGAFVGLAIDRHLLPELGHESLIISATNSRCKIPILAKTKSRLRIS
jgi:hypothetical protein